MILAYFLLTSILFTSFYPSVFFFKRDDNTTKETHKFHLRTSNIIAGFVVVVVLILDIPITMKVFVLIWKIVYLVFTRYYWRNPKTNPHFIFIPCSLSTLNMRAA